MSSRIQTLASLTGLDGITDEWKSGNNMYNVDYTNFDELIGEERKKSLQFLLKSFGANND